MTINGFISFNFYFYTEYIIMLNYHARDVVLIGCIAGVAAGSGWLLGKHYAAKCHKKARESGWLTVEAVNMPESDKLLDKEIAAWAKFNTQWNNCTNEVQWKDEWLYSGSRIVPDYWAERGNIAETKVARCDRFTDRYGRRGLMVRITETDGFVIYEAYVSKNCQQPVYLTTVAETYSATHAAPWLDALEVVLNAQRTATEAVTAADKATDEINEAIYNAQETASPIDNTEVVA